MTEYSKMVTGIYVLQGGTVYAEMTDVTEPDVSNEKVDTTTHDGGGVSSRIPGLQTYGDMSFKVHFIDDTAQAAVRTAIVAKTVALWQIAYPASFGTFGVQFNGFPLSAKKTTPLKGSPPTWTLTISPSSTTTELTSASPNLTTPFLAIADQSSNALTLTPSAAAAAYNYDCILYADDTAVTITPTATSGTIYVNRTIVATGIASGSISIPVTVAERTIFVVVVTSNNVPTVYRIRFIRGIANHP